MNFKKNWKRFWTLSSAREGFTLVELIVVIAILAILAGVAVPAYSGYVKKANMQADMTLASEVAHALTLYYYAHPEEVTSGYVVLTQEGDVCGFDAVGEKAMDAVFGDGWENTVSLKYDGWDTAGGGEGLLPWLVGSHDDGNGNAVANNTYGEIVNIANSSFLTGNTTDELMTNVENLTTKLAGIVEGMDQAGKDAVYLMFNITDATGTTTNALQTVMDQHGYSSLADVDATTLSNLVVLAAAEEMQNMDSAAMMGGNQPSAMSNYVTYYSLYTAYAANENSSQAYKDAYAQLQKDIQNESDPSNIMAMLNNFAVNITGDPANNIPADSGWAEYSGGSNPVGSSYFDEVDAFAGIMNAVDNANVSTGDLSDATLFTQGTVNTLFGSYVSAVEMIGGMSEEEYNAFAAAAKNGGVVVRCHFVGGEFNVENPLQEQG